MARVYSQLLVWQKALAGDSAAAGPNPGERWIIRDITAYNGNLLQIVDASVTTIDGIVLWQQSWTPGVGPDPWQHVEGRWVVDDSGGFVQLHATFPVDFLLNGYVLTLP